MEKYIEQMMSPKGILYRSFFMCKECEFVFTNLGQANYDIEGSCPACGEFVVDFAPKTAREKFIQGFKDEIAAFEQELSKE